MLVSKNKNVGLNGFICDVAAFLSDSWLLLKPIKTMKEKKRTDKEDKSEFLGVNWK